MPSSHREAIDKRNRRRWIYACLILVPYALFGMQYLPGAAIMAQPIGSGTLITPALVWFSMVVLIFLAVEFRFIRHRETEDRHD